MNTLSDILIALSSAQRELVKTLHAPAKWIGVTTENGVEVNHELEPSSDYYVQVYSSAGFSSAEDTLKKNVKLDCKIQKLSVKYVEQIEPHLFGEITYFSFGAYKTCYIINANLKYEDAIFHLSSATPEHNVAKCSLSREVGLQKIVASLDDIFLSTKGCKNVQQGPGKRLLKFAKQLESNECMMISSSESSLLLLTDITPDTNTTISEYFARYAKLVKRAERAYDKLCRESLSKPVQDLTI